MCWHWGFENVSNNIFFIFLESWLLAPIAIGNKNHCHFRYLMQLQNLLLSRFFSSCSEKRKEKENIHFPTAPKILLILSPSLYDMLYGMHVNRWRSYEICSLLQREGTGYSVAMGLWVHQVLWGIQTNGHCFFIIWNCVKNLWIPSKRSGENWY